MADENPTGGTRALPLDLPPSQVAWLRQTLTSCLIGVRGDLASLSGMPSAAKAREEADAYKRLLKALVRGEVVVPDEPARQAVEALAASTDASNQYERVVAEHSALDGLLARLDGEPI